MNLSRSRPWIMVLSALTVLVVQWFDTSERTTIWPPMLFVVLALVLYQGEIRKYDWAALRRIPFWESVMFAVTQGMIAQAVGIASIRYVAGIEPPDVPIEITPMVWISVIFFSAITEELVYRKIVLSSLQRYTGFWTGAVISSLLFALAHHNYSAYLGYFLLGLVWCRAYRNTGNLGVLIAAHIAFNAIAMIVIAVRG